MSVPSRDLVEATAATFLSWLCLDPAVASVGPPVKQHLGGAGVEAAQQLRLWIYPGSLGKQELPDRRSFRGEIFVQAENWGGFLSAALYEVLIDRGKPGVLAHFL